MLYPPAQKSRNRAREADNWLHLGLADGMLAFGFGLSRQDAGRA